MCVDEDDLTKWTYYNHAIIPACEPHEEITPHNPKKIFENFGGGILIRYTSQFDCTNETGWWYVIKDTEFDISALKSKRRYEITKGTKNFAVERICAKDYAGELFMVQKEAFGAYPPKYRPTTEEESFENYVENELCSDNALVYGAFHKESKELCGYAYLKKIKNVWQFSVLKTKPNSEREGVNAAIVYKILTDFSYEKKINPALYINDGTRSVLHETAFQDYLEKYFGFRKAYCKLNVIYNRKYKFIIKSAYVLRKLFYKLDGIGLIHKLNGILKMEEIVREQKK